LRGLEVKGTVAWLLLLLLMMMVVVLLLTGLCASGWQGRWAELLVRVVVLPLYANCEMLVASR